MCFFVLYFVYRKTFCPFINNECVKDCMFYSISSACYDDHCTRNCLIATMTHDARCLNGIFEILEDRFTVTKKNSPTLPNRRQSVLCSFLPFVLYWKLLYPLIYCAEYAVLLIWYIFLILKFQLFCLPLLYFFL